MSLYVDLEHLSRDPFKASSLCPGVAGSTHDFESGH